MAKAKTIVKPESNGDEPVSLSVLDLVLVDEDSKAELRVYADFEFIEEDINIFAINLSQARDIPPEGEIPAADAVVAYLYDQLYKTPSNSQAEEEKRLKFVTDNAQAYYRQQRDIILGEASVLAITNDNELTNEVHPYPDREPRKLHGVITIPPPKRDIENNGVERRLKQLRDYLEAHPNLATQFLSLRQNLNSRITLTMIGSAQKRQAGFQP